MRIHFVSFFGVDYDMDLLPWWSQWYLDRKLSSYTVFLHRFPKAVASDTKEWFRKLGFDVNIAPCEPFNDANLKRKTIGDFVATLPRDDYVIAPDDDEFQCMPGSNTPIDYSRECSRNDILMGCMIDRYAESRLLPNVSRTLSSNTLLRSPVSANSWGISRLRSSSIFAGRWSAGRN